MTARDRSSTRERILDTALGLLNAHGPAGVTTAAIADAAGLSQGNLHYHFRTKAAVVEGLLARFEHAVEALLGGEMPARIPLEDGWLFLQLLIETTDRHLFIVRDVDTLDALDPQLGRRARRLLRRLPQAMRRLCAAIATPSLVDGDGTMLDAVARAMTVCVAYSLSCERWAGAAAHAGADVAACAARTLALAAPLLDRTGRARLLRILPGEPPASTPWRNRE